MKYVLMIYGNDEMWTTIPPDQFQVLVAETDAHNRALQQSGEFIGAYGVGDQQMCKTVHLDGGAPVVTDGPYIEAKEYLGSFTIVDVETEARALEIAAANPAARFTRVEVRPLMHEAAPDM